MDLKALQATLREFSAEREWQPFHTPKNLAMALMVEAAELAEIFQWMTPEQSQAVRGDLVLQEQVADEVADVLLYLMQLADHTGIDLKRAVGRKLVKNAKKHPPRRPGLPGSPVESVGAVGVEVHVLVDWENVQPKDDDIRVLVPGVTDVWLFHGPNQHGVAAKYASFGDKATPVKIARTGKNALDFHLSFYMGYIAARHPEAQFVVVSNDKGYLPMLEHAAELGFSARQMGIEKVNASIAPMQRARVVQVRAQKVVRANNVTAKKVAAKKSAPQPAVKAVVAKPPSPPAVKAARQNVPAKKVPAKHVPAKKLPAARPAAAKKAVASRAAAPHAAPAVMPPGAATASNPSRVIDLNKAVNHVVASLSKMASKPTKQAKLVATIRSLLGPTADALDMNAVLSQLITSGRVVIDAKGAVVYALHLP